MQASSCASLRNNVGNVPKVSGVRCHAATNTVPKVIRDVTQVPALRKTSLDTIGTAFGENKPHAEGADVLIGKDKPTAEYARFWRSIADDFLKYPSTQLFSMLEGRAAAVVSAYPDSKQAPAEDENKEAPPFLLQMRPEGLVFFSEFGQKTGYWPSQYKAAYERNGRFYSIDFLAVHPELQGQGHGRALLEFLMQRADSDDMALFLVATNPLSRDWYARNGFKETGKRVLEDEEGILDLTFMERPPKSKRA